MGAIDPWRGHDAESQQLLCSAAAEAEAAASAAADSSSTMSWKAKIAGMTGRATMISVIADEVRACAVTRCRRVEGRACSAGRRQR